jgi:hypothetical protein
VTLQGQSGVAFRLLSTSRLLATDAEAAGMNLSGFVLPVLLAFIGLVVLVVGVVRVRRGAI